MSIKLSEEQQKILNHLDGQSIVVACPGSGKTTTMIARTKALVDKGVDENNILMITFTNAAAKNMKERYVKEYGPSNIRFGTIHSLCFQILCDELNYSKDNILNESTKYGYLAELLSKHVKTKMNRNDIEEALKTLMLDISYIKNSMTPVEKYDSEVPNFKKIYEDYENQKQSAHLIDFDDMLLITRNLLMENKEITDFYHNLYKYIMVDEYQDTNRVQADIIYTIVGENGNLCVVGDDDQSIYGFRSADSSIMLGFQTQFPNAVKFELDTNYRSGAAIINYADCLIKNNTIRFDKEFKCSRIEISSEVTVKTEIQNEDIVERLKNMTPEEYQECAILYRTNRQGAAMQSELATSKIPFYSTDKPYDFHKDKVFQSILSYYRLSRHKETKWDLDSILNLPSRYLKKEYFKNCPFDKNKLYACCDKAPLEKRRRIKGQITKMLLDIETLSGINDPAKFTEYLYYNIGFADGYRNYAEGFLGKDHYEVTQALKIVIKEAKKFKTMKEWICFAENYEKVLLEKNKEKKGVCLSTYHSAKGLEWKNVFLIDCIEGLTPYKKAEKPEEIEEERRLFYVAMTRAKDNLYMYTKMFNRSRFLNELGIK